MRIHRLILGLAVTAAMAAAGMVAPPASAAIPVAGCRVDCEDLYNATIDECERRGDAPQCKRRAWGTLTDCMYECRNRNAPGESVACHGRR